MDDAGVQRCNRPIIVGTSSIPTAFSGRPRLTDGTGGLTFSARTSRSRSATAARIAHRAIARRGSLSRQRHSRCGTSPAIRDQCSGPPPSGNDPNPGKVLSGIGHTPYVLARGIECVGVHIKATVANVGEDEVALPRIGLRPLLRILDWPSSGGVAAPVDEARRCRDRRGVESALPEERLRPNHRQRRSQARFLRAGRGARSHLRRSSDLCNHSRREPRDKPS